MPAYIYLPIPVFSYIAYIQIIFMDTVNENTKQNFVRKFLLRYLR